MNRHHDKCAKSIWLTNWSIHPRTHIDIQTHAYAACQYLCDKNQNRNVAQTMLRHSYANGSGKGRERGERGGRDRTETEKKAVKDKGAESGKERWRKRQIGLTDWSRACWVRRGWEGVRGD